MLVAPNIMLMQQYNWEKRSEKITLFQEKKWHELHHTPYLVMLSWEDVQMIMNVFATKLTIPKTAMIIWWQIGESWNVEEDSPGAARMERSSLSLHKYIDCQSQMDFIQ